MVKFEIMKKILFFTLAIFILASCTKEDIKKKDVKYTSKDDLLGKVETVEEFMYDTSGFTDVKDIFKTPKEHKSYRYNRLGNLVEYKESCASEEDKVEKIVSYIYNENNLLIKKNTYESSDCNYHTQEYTYNDKNLLVKEVEHCTEKAHSKKIYTYNESNLLKEIDVYEYDDMSILYLKRKYRYSFKGEDEIIEYFNVYNKYTFKKNGEELNYEEFKAKYGTKEDLSTWNVKVVFDYERLHLTKKIKYDSIYIKRPKSIFLYVSVYESDNKDAKLTKLSLLENSLKKYNKRGLVTDITKYSNYIFYPQISKYIYEYKEDGNWKKKTSCLKDEVKSITKRTYTYFQ
jgi:hypothetical protein